jgi:hypothetical protein
VGRPAPPERPQWTDGQFPVQGALLLALAKQVSFSKHSGSASAQPQHLRACQFGKSERETRWQSGQWKLHAEDDRPNPDGSGISLGHPIGATGARILTTAAHEALRRNARYVLEAMCTGGGQGWLAPVFEAVA